MEGLQVLDRPRELGQNLRPKISRRFLPLITVPCQYVLSRGTSTSSSTATSLARLLTACCSSFSFLTVSPSSSAVFTFFPFTAFFAPPLALTFFAAILLAMSCVSGSRAALGETLPNGTRSWESVCRFETSAVALSMHVASARNAARVRCIFARRMQALQYVGVAVQRW